MSMFRRTSAEFLGTFWLVFGGCGSAVLAAAFPEVGIGLTGVSLAFGLTVLTMAYSVGHISGCHLNPAVTIGLWAGGRFPAKDILPYIIAQLVGAFLAAVVLYVIASGKADCEASAAARALRQTREAEESLRLLYVALTRARERLILCGRIAANRKEEGIKGWWAAIKAGFAHERIAPHVRPAACGEIMIERYGPDPVALGRVDAAAPRASTLPAWTSIDPAPEAFARYASPSDLGEGTHVAAPSPLSAAGGLGRFRRGDLIHRLLQVLPDLPPAERAAGARALLAREPDLSDDQRAEMAGAALSVLDDRRFAEVFGPGSRAEVAIAGTAATLPPGLKISGRIDRLVVLPDRVLVADFKTNRPSPDRIEDADPAYLRQMALYAAVLDEVFPGRRIEAALVWTDGPKLMTVPEKLMERVLAELRRGG